MEIRQHIPLAPYTTFKVGGTADYFCRARSPEDIQEAIIFARDKNIPFFVLGGGSNILVADEGYRGLVIQLDLRGVFFEDRGGEVLCRVAAGEKWDDFVALTVARGLYGLENLSGIPGTVGASPVQNIGAYGVEVKETIVRVETIDASTNTIKNFSNRACRFGYRTSFFKSLQGKNFIITRVTFLLQKKGSLNLSYKDVREYFKEKKIMPTLEEVRAAILEIRSRKFPDLARYGTAGSFFKNPIISKSRFKKLHERFSNAPSYPVNKRFVKVPAGWLIQEVGGYKGFEQDAVRSFENQALVIVNTRNASAVDIFKYARMIQEEIQKKTEIILEFEVQLVGFSSEVD